MSRRLVLLALWALLSAPALAGAAAGLQDWQPPASRQVEELDDTNHRILVLALVVLGFGVGAYVLGAVRSRAAEIKAYDYARKDPCRQHPEERLQAMRALESRDPQFDPDVFLTHARRTFLEVRTARAQEAVQSAARLMSDGLLRRELVELALRERQGRRSVEVGALVDGAEVVAAECDAAYDTLHVVFYAEVRRAEVGPKVDREQAQLLAAQKPLSRVKEVWSFERRLEPGRCAGRLAEGKCPSCGAPVERSAVASCQYCQAILNSGAHDWVLAKISRGDDFFCSTRQVIPGWAALRARDPLVNRPVLEDRASLVFWKWVETHVSGTPERFARLCTPAAFETLAQCATEMPRGFERIDLGEVRLALVDCEPDRERAHFILYWCTATERWELPRKSMLTLERAAGVRTREETGLATDRCHHCAGFQKELDAVECAWCGALLPNDWSFVNLVPLDDFYETRHAQKEQADSVAALIGEAANPHESLRLLAAVAAMVRVDGPVRESERALLLRCAERWGVPPERAMAMLEAPMEGQLSSRPRGEREARRVLRGLAAAACVDGGLGTQERRLLGQLSAQLKLPPGALKAALDEFEAARDERREQAGG
ncbi:MAG: TerB family tellurite resistance protein [Deltaproteobacteria bacterium]|nr:TerB family tellurite resistance protein [Deltaproteobacteria bacterium]